MSAPNKIKASAGFDAIAQALESLISKKIQELNPRSISIASFLVKPESNKFRFKIDYIGFEIPSDFVVGYGLDFNEKYRNLDSLFCLINK